MRLFKLIASGQKEQIGKSYSIDSGDKGDRNATPELRGVSEILHHANPIPSLPR
jgi:hypothetical protein